MVLIIKLFGTLLSLSFGKKSSTHNKTTLIEQNLILDKNENFSEILIFYQCSFKSNIPKYHDKTVNIDHNEDPITRAKERYKNYS